MSDKEFVSNEMLERISFDDLPGWETFYERYAAMMLGVICTLTDKERGERLLLEIFSDKQFEDFLRSLQPPFLIPLCAYCIRYSHAKLLGEGRSLTLAAQNALPIFFRKLYLNNPNGRAASDGILHESSLLKELRVKKAVI